MEYRTLKATGWKVSRFSFGTWSLAGSKNWGANDEAESKGAVDAAIDMGINLMDTAAKYNDGVGEEILGRCLKGKRDKVILATKIYTGDLAYDDVLRECENSLRRLATDHIDLYQIHWPSRTIPLDGTFRAFDKLKADGKIRAVGVCNFGVNCVKMIGDYPIAFNQLPYSLLWRQIENEILPATTAAGISIWPYSPLAQGLLTGKFKSVEDVPLPRRELRFYSGEWKQGRHNDTGFEKEIFAFLPKLQAVADKAGVPMAALALAFLKARPGVDSVLIGARSREQLTANVKMFDMAVPADALADATKLADELKPQMGTNPDMWVNEDGGRFY